MKEQTKKAELNINALFTVGMIILVTAFVLSVGGDVIEGLKTTQLQTDASNNATNDTVTVVGLPTDQTALGHKNVVPSSLLNCSNVTHTITKGIGFVLSDSVDGYLTFNGSGVSVANNSDKYNCSYRFETYIHDVGYNATEAGGEAVLEFAGWLPTIALVVAASVIIGLLVMFMLRKFGEA